MSEFSKAKAIMTSVKAKEIFSDKEIGGVAVLQRSAMLESTA